MSALALEDDVASAAAETEAVRDISALINRVKVSSGPYISRYPATQGSPIDPLLEYQN